MMTAQGYAFTYAGRQEPAIERMDFSIAEGEVVLIAGDSGSGKSTFLKSLNGLIPEISEGRMEGRRFLHGKSMEQLPIYEISRSIGSVFQNPRSQFFTLDSTSEMVFAMENYGLSRAEMQRRLRAVQAAVPIAPIMDRDIHTLSSGEKQLLALASAMAPGPDALLFDEPSANLDYANAMHLRRTIRRLKSMGKTVLVADHRFYYLRGLIDRVFLIRDHTLQVFDSEEAFRASSYNTRSFDLFGLDMPFNRAHERGRAVAGAENACKWGVLNNVSFTLYDREITVLVGVNGAGKTTLARLLTGALRPDAGLVWADGLPFCVMQDADYQLFGTSVENELEIGLHALPMGKKKEVLERLDLWARRDSHPFDLSGGEKQRLQIAVAALSDAGLVIFDEPTSGLDARSMERVAAEIKALAKDRAVLIVSHDYELIRKVAGRVIYLKDGRIERDFTLSQDTIEDFNQIFISMEEEHEP